MNKIIKAMESLEKAIEEREEYKRICDDLNVTKFKNSEIMVYQRKMELLKIIGEYGENK
jgi:hypothetical protein